MNAVAREYDSCSNNISTYYQKMNIPLDFQLFVILSRQGTTQDDPFFYTPSHLSELKRCKSIISTDFRFVFIFKQYTTFFSHLIVS